MKIFKVKRQQQTSNNLLNYITVKNMKLKHRKKVESIELRGVHRSVHWTNRQDSQTKGLKNLKGITATYSSSAITFRQTNVIYQTTGSRFCTYTYNKIEWTGYTWESVNSLIPNETNMFVVNEKKNFHSSRIIDIITKPHILSRSHSTN